MDIKKTANLFVNFTIRRLAEIFGLVIFGTGILIMISLLTYSPEDPNFIFPTKQKLKICWVFMEVLFPIYFFNPWV